MPEPSKHIRGLADAMSIRWNTRVYEMQANNLDVTVLSLGEAFFDVPLRGLDDIDESLHYSHSRGIARLREVIADDYEPIAVDPDTELIVTAGSKIAIYMALLTMLDPGDEVLIPEPAWVSYTEQVRLCHGVPVTIPYDVDCRRWEEYVTDRTRAIIVNTPSNPRGTMLDRDDWNVLHELAERRSLFLLSDEAYSLFVPAGKRFITGLEGDPMKRHTVVCNSISKNFGMSGWRIGYVLGSRIFIEELLKAQQHLVTCSPTPLSAYVAEHYNELKDATRSQIAAVVERRAEMVDYLDEIGVKHLGGDCTFYVFVSTCPSTLGSVDFCTRLLEEHHVAAVPGIGYGESCDQFIRVSVGTESIARTKAAFGAVRKLIDVTSSGRIAV